MKAYIWQRRYTLLWLALIGYHLYLISVFMPFSKVASNQPLFNVDYALHYYQVERAVDAFEKSGRLWSYDPSQLAGYPTGVIEDMSVRSLQLFVIALHKLGVDNVVAFNLYALFVMLTVPFLAWIVGFIYRLSERERFFLGVLWVLLWFFDASLHWNWFCGMLSWGLSAPLSVIAVGLVWRVFSAFKENLKTPHWALLIATLLALSFTSFLHPLAVVAVALPSAILYLHVFKRGWKVHLFTLGALFAASAGAAIWLIPSLPFWKFVESSHIFLRPTPDYILLDWIEFQISKQATGPVVQTGLRFLGIASAIYILLRFKRENDKRFLPLILLIGIGFFLAYFGRYIGIFSTMQPYRFINVMALAAAIPTAILLSSLLRASVWKSFSPKAKALVIIFFVLLLPRFYRTAYYIFPSHPEYVMFEDLMPSPKHPINIVMGARKLDMVLDSVPSFFREIRAWLVKHPPKGRILVSNYELGEYLAATTRFPVIGGFAFRPFIHGDANFFQYLKEPKYERGVFNSYLNRYAISTVILDQVRWSLENDKKAFSFDRAFDGLNFRIFRSNQPVSYFAVGKGKLISQNIDDLRFKEVEPNKDGLVIVRFHYDERLKCRSLDKKQSCKIQRFKHPKDRVGFIGIKNPPKDFQLYID